MQFEPEREDTHARVLGEALAGKQEEGPTPVDALEELEELEDTAEAVTDRIEHADKLFRAAAAGQLLERDLLTGEIGALLGLLQRLDKAGRFDEELRLARALHGLLVLAFRWYDLIRSLGMVLGAARKAGHEAGQAWALHELGTLHLCAGNAKQAVEYLEEALAFEERLGDAVGRCPTRHNLDSARRDLGATSGGPPRFRRLALVAGALAFFGAGAAVAFIVDDPPTNQTVTLAVDKVGDGEGTVASANGAIACGNDCSEELEAGSTVTLTAAADDGSAFVGWEDVDCDGQSCPVTLDDDLTVRAVFDLVPLEDRTLSVEVRGSGSVSGEGIDCPDDCDETLEAGTTVTLTAAADDGSAFARWEDVECEQEGQEEGSCTVTLAENTTVGAVFEQGARTLTVSRRGDGSGSVSGEGIDCPDDCDETFEAGSTVTLTAAAADGSAFARWEDVECEQEEQEKESCTVTVDDEMTAVAVFEPVVTLSIKNAGSGTVTIDPGGIDCDGCNADFAKGAEVTLTPVPDDGWVFAGWGKVCDGMKGDCTVVLTESTVAVAEFREVEG